MTCWPLPRYARHPARIWVWVGSCLCIYSVLLAYCSLPSCSLKPTYYYYVFSFVRVSVQAISCFWECHISSPVRAVDGSRGRSGRILGHGEILGHSCTKSCRRLKGEHGAFILFYASCSSLCTAGTARGQHYACFLRDLIGFFWYCGWWNTGADCLENLSPWRFWKLGWTRPSATWYSSEQEAGPPDLQRPLST